MKEVMKKAKQRINMLIMSVYMTIVCASVAYASGVEGQLQSMVEKGVDTVFMFTGGGIGLYAIYTLITGIFTYVKGMNEADSRQSSEASNGITKGLICLVVAIVVFAFKTPFLGLLQSMYAV